MRPLHSALYSPLQPASPGASVPGHTTLTQLVTLVCQHINNITPLKSLSVRWQKYEKNMTVVAIRGGVSSPAWCGGRGEGVLWQPTGSRQREEREFCHCQKLATSTRDQARQFCYQISAKELSLVLKVLDHVDFEFQRKKTKSASVSVSHKRTINWKLELIGNC